MTKPRLSVAKWPTFDLFPRAKSKALAYVYLFQLAIPLFFLTALQAEQMWLGLALLILLAFLYILSYRAHRPAYIAILTAETAITMYMAAFMGLGYFWLALYPMTAMVAGLPKRQYLIFIPVTGLLLFTELGLLWHNDHVSLAYAVPYLVLAIVGALGTLFSIALARRQEETNHALKRANREIERLTLQAERDRISQDLHDVLGHELAMISLKAQLAGRLVTRDPSKASCEILDIEEAARTALAQVRGYIAGTHRPEWTQEWQSAQALMQTAGIACDVAQVPLHVQPNHPAPAVLSMALREAATNIVRHSEAHHAVVRLEVIGDVARLTVADDGIGLQGKAAASGSQDGMRMDRARLGLAGMRARIAVVGGELHLWSAGRELTDAQLPLPTCVPWVRGVTLQVKVPLGSVVATGGAGT